MTARNFVNTATPVALSTGVSASTGDNTLSVASTAGFPPVPFTLAIDRGQPGLEELCLCTATTATTFTVTRGYDGTTSKSHAAGAAVEHSVAAIDYTEANFHINDQNHDQHTQYLRKDMLTTKGDLYVATGAGAPVRVGVGTEGQVLAAQGAAAAGVGWVSPSVAPGAIGTTQLADASVTQAKMATGLEGVYVGANVTRPTTPAAGSMFSASDLPLIQAFFSGAWYNVASYGPWTFYAPTWTNGGNIGNGTLQGYYSIVGKTMNLRIHLSGGTTTTWGATDLTHGWQFSLPAGVSAASTPNTGRQVGSLLLQNVFTTWYRGICSVGPSGTVTNAIVAQDSGAPVNATHPFTWGATDTLDLHLTIEIR